MNLPSLFEKVRPWLKPVLTILLGLILIFRPDSLTSAIATGIGFIVSVIGCGMLLAFFFGQEKDGLKLAVSIILMVLGFGIINSPLSLASQVGRFIGLILVLKSAHEISSYHTVSSRSMSVVSGIVGIVLIFVPIASFRLVGSVCGLVVLLVGIGMAVTQWRNDNSGSGRDTIIDAL